MRSAVLHLFVVICAVTLVGCPFLSRLNGTWVGGQAVEGTYVEYHYTFSGEQIELVLITTTMQIVDDELQTFGLTIMSRGHYEIHLLDGTFVATWLDRTIDIDDPEGLLTAERIEAIELSVEQLGVSVSEYDYDITGNTLWLQAVDATLGLLLTREN